MLSEHNFDGDGPSIKLMIYYDIVFLLNFDMGQVQQCLIGAYNPGPGKC